MPVIVILSKTGKLGSMVIWLEYETKVNARMQRQRWDMMKIKEWIPHKYSKWSLPTHSYNNMKGSFPSYFLSSLANMYCEWDHDMVISTSCTIKALVCLRALSHLDELEDAVRTNRTRQLHILISI